MFSNDTLLTLIVVKIFKILLVNFVEFLQIFLPQHIINCIEKIENIQTRGNIRN